ncbi:hypothetical protein [Endozoicomonas ascidiicola]|uniref:hypothetical protein n=1 Tax=Endozoicomonas ascidiicola TaxID=1698521 RepID=UPI00082CD6EE|nr:hypothetical protein [Endozoicomonas ascidiicola]
MPITLKLVDVRKLQKTSSVVMAESQAVVESARKMLAKQEEFMEKGGMDREKLRAFINSDHWSAKQRQKAREELLRFHSELKSNMKQAADEKRKDMALGRRLLKQENDVVKGQRVKKKRSGFV